MYLQKEKKNHLVKWLQSIYLLKVATNLFSSLSILLLSLLFSSCWLRAFDLFSCLVHLCAQSFWASPPKRYFCNRAGVGTLWQKTLEVYLCNPWHQRQLQKNKRKKEKEKTRNPSSIITLFPRFAVIQSLHISGPLQANGRCLVRQGVPCDPDLSAALACGPPWLLIPWLCRQKQYGWRPVCLLCVASQCSLWRAMGHSDHWYAGSQPLPLGSGTTRQACVDN